MSKKLISIPKGLDENPCITIDIETSPLYPKESKIFDSMDAVRGRNLHTYILFYKAAFHRRTATCMQEVQGMILTPYLIKK